MNIKIIVFFSNCPAAAGSAGHVPTPVSTVTCIGA